MGIVNADTSEVLRSLSNIKNAISSIETTKTTLVKKYQLLGNEWKDTKYKELGDVVQESCKALNEILKILLKGEVFVNSLAKNLREYEETTLGSASIQGQNTSELDTSSRAFGSNGGIGFFSNLFNRNDNIMEALNGVEYKPIEPSSLARSEQQIIDNISGGDKTKGSCSSLALAYAGNRAGYVVNDFRGGRSCRVFSARSSIEQIANLEGVNSVVLRGTDDTLCATRLEERMERGKEYYMATGRHAAIVRLNDNGIHQYLELQSGVPSENGWQLLTLEALYTRFGCQDGQSSAYANYLIELDSLQNNTEFLNLLGYINTNESAQMRGADGHVR